MRKNKVKKEKNQIDNKTRLFRWCLIVGILLLVIAFVGFLAQSCNYIRK